MVCFGRHNLRMRTLLKTVKLILALQPGLRHWGSHSSPGFRHMKTRLFSPTMILHSSENITQLQSLSTVQYLFPRAQARQPLTFAKCAKLQNTEQYKWYVLAATVSGCEHYWKLLAPVEEFSAEAALPCSQCYDMERKIMDIWQNILTLS
jgi:hypothetical protein